MTAAADSIPVALLDQLAPGGIMIMPVGGFAMDQYVQRIVKTDAGLQTSVLLPVRFVPLVPGTEQ